MASPPTLLASSRPPVSYACAAGASLIHARREDPNSEGNLRVSKTCDAGVERDADKEYNPSTDHGRPQQHSHECVLQLGTSAAAEPSGPVFILDSGAARHVVGDKTMFSSPVTTATRAAAHRARDGRQLAVAGVGTISCDGFHLTNVMHVPDLGTGAILVSVQQLAERGYLVMFGGGQCHVKDRSGGKTIGKGRMHDDDGLYHLEFLNIPPCTADANLVRPQHPV